MNRSKSRIAAVMLSALTCSAGAKAKLSGGAKFAIGAITVGCIVEAYNEITGYFNGKKWYLGKYSFTNIIRGKNKKVDKNPILNKEINIIKSNNGLSQEQEEKFNILLSELKTVAKKKNLPFDEVQLKSIFTKMASTKDNILSDNFISQYDKEAGYMIINCLLNGQVKVNENEECEGCFMLEFTVKNPYLAVTNLFLVVTKNQNCKFVYGGKSLLKE